MGLVMFFYLMVQPVVVVVKAWIIKLWLCFQIYFDSLNEKRFYKNKNKCLDKSGKIIKLINFDGANHKQINKYKYQ